MSRVRRNIAANFIGRGWGIVSVYLFVPLYLQFLGVEAYGLVGVYSMLVGILALADVGLTATLSREMARLGMLNGAEGRMRDLLRTYEVAYLAISLASAVGLWMTAPYLASRWLQAGTLTPAEITTAIRAMGIAIAFQLPSGLYNGGLLGLQRQVTFNALQVAWGILRGVGSVAVLWLVSPTIIAFAICQLAVNAIYCIAVRTSLWRAMPARTLQPHFDRGLLRETWQYAAGMASISVLSAALTQTDKLVVSKILPLEMLGYYSLAGTLASVPLMLANPVGMAIFPRLTGLVAVVDREALLRLYHRACSLVSIVVLPCALTFLLYSDNLLFAWTGSSTVVQHVGLTTAFLLAGQIMQAITVIPFYLALAHGQTRLIVRVQLLGVLLIMPLLMVLVGRVGVVGGGIAWLVMNVCTLCPYMYFLHRRFLRGELQTWAQQDVGRPLVSALAVAVLGRWVLPLPATRLASVATVVLVWAMAMAASALSVAEWRGILAQKARDLIPASNVG